GRLFRLPLRIQQVLQAVQNDRLGLDRAQRLGVVAVLSWTRANIVPLVRPRLIDPVVRVERLHEVPFLLREPRQDVEWVLELVTRHFRCTRREEIEDVPPEPDALLRRTRVVTAV